MIVTDPIADMLTRIRNAYVSKHENVDIPTSKVKKSLAEILLNEGYIDGVDYIEDSIQGVIRIKLKYADGQSVIQGLKRISKPGLRIYARSSELPKVLGGLGIAVVSTSKGIMTDKQARKENIGGEVLAYVW